MTFTALIASINQYIITNGNNEITAAVLNPILREIAQWAKDNIGDLTDLTTDTQENLVAAINELNEAIQNINNGGVQIYQGTDDPNVTPPAVFSTGDFYLQVDGSNNPVQLYQYNGFTWITPSDQNNIGKKFLYTFVDESDLTIQQIVDKINFSGSFGNFVISETDTPVIVQAIKVQSTGIINRKYFFTGGKGTWGSGAGQTEVLPEHLELLGNFTPTVQDVDSSNTQTIGLGELPDGDYLTAANSQERNLTEEDIVYFFSYIQDDVSYLLTFTGEPGVYGGEGNPPFTTDNLIPFSDSGVEPTPEVPTFDAVVNAGENPGWSDGQMFFTSYAVGGEPPVSDPASEAIYNSEQVRLIYYDPDSTTLDRQEVVLNALGLAILKWNNGSLIGGTNLQPNPTRPFHANLYLPSTGDTLASEQYVDALGATKADLVGGKVPASQLPSFVDDVVEYADLASFPATGEDGKLYVALDTNLVYRWSGSTYVEISPSIPAIPLSGTETGAPVTGDIEVDMSAVFNLFQTNSSGVKRVKFYDDMTMEFGTETTASGYESKVIIEGSQVTVRNTNPASKGLAGEQDFTSNITSLDYVQKKYVDDAIEAQTLQNVTDNGAITTNSISIASLNLYDADAGVYKNFNLFDNKWRFEGLGGFFGILDFGSITTDRTYTLENKSGTIPVKQSVVQVVVCDMADSTALTGTTSETILKTYTIPANTLGVGAFWLDAYFDKVGTAGTAMIRIYKNTVSNTLDGNQVQIATAAIGATQLYYPVKRQFRIKPDGKIHGFPFVAGAASDAPTTLGDYDTNFDTAVTEHIIVTISLTSAADTVKVTGVEATFKAQQ